MTTAAPIAVVDTSSLLLLIENVPGDAERQRRRHANQLSFDSLRTQRARFIIPTPVIAELHDHPRVELAKLLASRLAGVRTEPLDARAAEIAGAIRRDVLRSREGRERGAVTYDALIAAIAERLNARWLLTANPSDMRRCLSAIGSAVEVVDTTAIPERGQLHILAHQTVKS